MVQRVQQRSVEFERAVLINFNPLEHREVCDITKRILLGVARDITERRPEELLRGRGIDDEPYSILVNHNFIEGRRR